MKGTRSERHFGNMKALFFLPLLFALSLQADEAQDRAAINKVIVALNDSAQRAGLFTKDVDSMVDFARLVDLHRAAVSGSGIMIGRDETWIGLTVPRVVNGTIRFVTRDVALVDGASTIEGAVTLARRVPLLFVMRRESAQWKISAVRVLAPEATPRIN
jgi:hypothetical protein